MEMPFRPLPYQALAAHPSQTIWRSFLPERLRVRTQETALIVAERLRDPDLVHTTAERARRQSLYPSGWSPTSLASGDLGVALMYAYVDCCFPGQGWDAMTHQYLSLVAAGTQQMTIISPNLFSGTSGLALALSLANKGGERYQKTLARLHQRLCDQVLNQVWRRPESDGGVASSDFDVIVGAAGVLTYLVSVEQPDEQIQSAIERLVTYLTWLGEPGQPKGQERWYIPPALLPNEQHREWAPQGNFNCGLAHGIPGPLAALALAALAGYHFPGLHESIAYLANWMVAHQVTDAWGHISWPETVPFEVASSPQDWQHLPATRAAWCYGAPGVAVTRRIGLPRRQGNPSKNERQGYSSNPEAQRITLLVSLPVLQSFDARLCSLRAPSGTLA